MVEAGPQPITVDMVFQALLTRHISTSLGTVYRVLVDLEAAGLLMRNWVQGHVGLKAVYSTVDQDLDHTAQPTHRFVCQRCGHSTAFHDVLKELREQLHRFTDINGTNALRACLTIETEACASCRGTEPQRLNSEAQHNEKTTSGDPSDVCALGRS